MLEQFTETQIASLRKRLFNRVVTSVEGDGCWLWPGAQSRHGYGLIACGAQGMVPVHRVAYELTAGPIPAGAFVCHRCNHRACLRPDHLFLGSRRESVANRCAKGHTARGTRQGRAKLTASDVRQIRALLATGVTQQTIARQFAVCHQTIHDIKTRRSWRWLVEEDTSNADADSACVTRFLEPPSRR
jgi:HNH endonuclease